MFIQSDDFIDFNAPVLIENHQVKKQFLIKYLYADLVHPLKINSVQCGPIEVKSIIIKPRILSIFERFKNFPIEVIILTSNHYEKTNKDCKCVLATGYLYNGLPKYD